ncbi:MAG: DUF4402 domain-containing protein [Fusobacteriaceae bacterium]
MTKLLMLLSCTLSILAFANASGEASMNINATVIKPLTIEVTKDMDFGKIIQGSTATAEGTYKIDGEPGQKIDVITTFPKTLTNNIDKSLALPINFNMPMPLAGYSLGNDGNLEININGSISPTTSTRIGDYTGSLTARVQYQ